MFNAKEVKDEIILWIKDYFLNNATDSTLAVIGISGGKDSSIVAALCKEALGANRVLGVLMPQGVQQDIDMSYKLCEFLGIKYININVSNPVNEIYNELIKNHLKLNDICIQNTPARIRMTTLYAVSAIVGGRVANTCNLSENYVGYSTKYGDSAGDFSPLLDLTVKEVKEIGLELGLPNIFVDKTPIDGLCGKSDEENLGFSYEVLDKYIKEGICDDMVVKNKINLLHTRNSHKVRPMPKYEQKKCK